MHDALSAKMLSFFPFTLWGWKSSESLFSCFFFWPFVSFCFPIRNCSIKGDSYGTLEGLNSRLLQWRWPKLQFTLLNSIKSRSLVRELCGAVETVRLPAVSQRGLLSLMLYKRGEWREPVEPLIMISPVERMQMLGVVKFTVLLKTSLDTQPIKGTVQILSCMPDFPFFMRHKK